MTTDNSNPTAFGVVNWLIGPWEHNEPVRCS